MTSRLILQSLDINTYNALIIKTKKLHKFLTINNTMYTKILMFKFLKNSITL